MPENSSGERDVRRRRAVQLLARAESTQRRVTLSETCRGREPVERRSEKLHLLFREQTIPLVLGHEPSPGTLQRWVDGFFRLAQSVENLQQLVVLARLFVQIQI